MSHAALLQEDDLYYADTPVGDILRYTRERYHQSLSDVENALHIRAFMLQAIENGQYETLPGRTYTVGFIRTYAEYLGLNPERMVKLFKSQASAAPRKNLSERAPVANDHNVPKGALVAASLVAFALALLLTSGQKIPTLLIKDAPPAVSISPSALFLEKDSIAPHNALNPSAEQFYY